MELFAADGHDAGGCERVTGKSGMRPWERKRVEYLESGIGPHADGGDPEGTLIETRDEPRGGLDAAVIASGIDRVILRDA